MDNDAATLGLLLDFAKQHLGLNQKELIARMCDPQEKWKLKISQPVLTNMKNGKGQFPPFKYRQALSALHDILLEKGFRADAASGQFVSVHNPGETVAFKVFAAQAAALRPDEMPEKQKLGKTAPSPAGLTRCNTFQQLETSRLYESIAHGREIWIMSTYLSASEEFERTFRAAIHNNPTCQIRVLLLDPHLSAAHLRAKGLSTSDRFALQNLIQNVSRLRKIEEEFPKNFNLRLYNAVPGLCFYRVDDTCLWGFFWFEKLTRDGTFFETPFHPSSKDDFFSKDIKRNFESLWKYAGDFHKREHFDVRFKCHMLYPEGTEFVKKTMLLSLDTKYLDAMLTNTPSETEYHGTITPLREGNICIHLLVNNSAHEGSNSAFFDLHLDLSRIRQCEIATGLFIVSSPKKRDCTYAKKVLLENIALRSKKSTAERERLIEKVLGTDIIKNDLFSIHSWDGLSEELAKQ